MFFLSSTSLACSLSSLLMPSFQERKRLAAPLTVLETVLRSVRSTYGKGWEDDELFGRFGDCEVLLLLCIGRIGDVPRRRSAMTRLSILRLQGHPGSEQDVQVGNRRVRRGFSLIPTSQGRGQGAS